MLDCLPQSEEWSPRSQFAFFRDHLQAAKEHLNTFEQAAATDFKSALAHQEQLTELIQRLSEAEQLFRQLQALSPEAQQQLTPDSKGETP